MHKKQTLVDLQVHSTYSDGSLTPSELFNFARKSNVEILVVCDHDAAEGMPEVEQSAKKYKMPFVSGIEMTVTYKSNELHILGYGFDYKHVAIKRVGRFYANSRVIRIKQMINKLNRIGYTVRFSDVSKRAGKIIGRPHLADQVIFDKGNHNKLIATFGYVPDRSEFIQKYLIKGAIAYAEKKNLSAKEAINLIHKAGGVSVLSHPLGRRYSPDLSLWPINGSWIQNLKTLRKMGLDGVEAYASDHYLVDINNLNKFAKRYKMIVTGGSDFHNKDIPGLPLGYISKKRSIPHRLGEQLLKIVQK